MIIQENDSEKLVNDVGEISTRIQVIDSMSNVTLNNFNAANNKTEEVIDEIDSLHARMSLIINRDRKLISQYNKLNKQLESQMNYNEKLMKANAPILTVTSDKIYWEKSNEFTYCKICFQNSGNRPLEIQSLKGKINLEYKDKTNEEISFNPLIKKELLAPVSTGKTMYCRNSNKFKMNTDSLEIKLTKAKITINTSTLDVATGEIKKEEILKGWNKEKGFHNLSVFKVTLPYKSKKVHNNR